MSTESNQFRYLLDLLHDKEIEEARKEAKKESKTGFTEHRTVPTAHIELIRSLLGHSRANIKNFEKLLLGFWWILV